MLLVNHSTLCFFDETTKIEPIYAAYPGPEQKQVHALSWQPKFETFGSTHSRYWVMSGHVLGNFLRVSCHTSSGAMVARSTGLTDDRSMKCVRLLGLAFALCSLSRLLCGFSPPRRFGFVTDFDHNRIQTNFQWTVSRSTRLYILTSIMYTSHEIDFGELRDAIYNGSVLNRLRTFRMFWSHTRTSSLHNPLFIPGSSLVRV